MDFRNVLFLICISLLLFGTAFAQKTVNDFEIDESYDSAHNGTYDSLYLNEKQDSGISIFKNVAGEDDDMDAFDDLVHDDVNDYLTPDDDYKIDKNSDNTFNFTDYEMGEHGVGEVISCDGGEYTIIFWTKDNSGMTSKDLTSLLNEFNKDNKVEAIAF